MLKVLLIGGKEVEEASEKIKGVNYEITHKIDYIDTAFNEILENSVVFLDTDVILVLQYGFRNNIDYEEQIISIQEVLDFSESKAKLYFVIKDAEQFESLNNNDNLIIREDVKILLLDRITIKDINEIIKGNYDDIGLGANKQSHTEVEQEYDVEGQEDNDEEKFFDLSNTPDDEYENNYKVQTENGENLDDYIKNREILFDQNEEDTDSEDDDDLSKIKKERVKEKARSNKENKPRQRTKTRTRTNGIEVDSRFLRGVIAVTGDRNSGVSTTTANIGKVCADMGVKTLILDFDFTRRGQSLLFSQFREEATLRTNINLGTYSVLNNFGMLKDVSVVVEDNLALVSMTRDGSFYVKSFANKKIEDLTTSERLTKVIGGAKADFDLILIDIPIEELYKNLETSMLVDKFVLCMENNVLCIGNTLEINMVQISQKNEIMTNNIMDKANIVLTKFNDYSIFKNKVMDEEVLGEIIRYNFVSNTKVVGRITYEKDFVVQNNKLACDFNTGVREEITNIINNIFS